MIVKNEDPFCRPRWPPPGRKASPERLGERLAFKPARFISLEASPEIAERQKKAASARDRFTVSQRLSGLKGRQRFVEAAEIAQRQRFAAQSRGKARPRRARTAVGAERLLHPVEFHERIAEVDRGFGEVRAERERPSRGFERLFEASEFAQDASATAPGVGVAGRKRARRFESRERLGKAALLK